MIEELEPQAQPATRRELPLPTRTRWQPLRIGVLELFHYDSEEFWFRDGHLLLRGNNGTGKSKVLSLTLPFLFDAQLKSSRVEPDGDPGKKMAWNLLLGSIDRRIGYAWIEFGRLGDDGMPHYLTLGAGLSAAAARAQVDSWFFLIDGGEHGPRLNQDLWLTNRERVVLSRDRLRESLQGSGQVFDTAHAYRRAVDERLFKLGTYRYEALIDTLIQLRQPQLSRKPDESALSNALTEALPPIAPELLADVADALGQLEDDRRRLAEVEALALAVERFDKRYRIYAGTRTRREARSLRHAQTEFDNTSHVRIEAQAQHVEAQRREEKAKLDEQALDTALAGHRRRLETLQSHPTMKDANRLESAERDAKARALALSGARSDLVARKLRLERTREESARLFARLEGTKRALAARRADSAAHAAEAGMEALYLANGLATMDSPTLAELSKRDFEALPSALRAIGSNRRLEIRRVRQRIGDLQGSRNAEIQRQHARDDAHVAAQTAAAKRTQADEQVDGEGRALVQAWASHFACLKQLQPAGAAALSGLTEWVALLEGQNPAQLALSAAQHDCAKRLSERRAELEKRRRDVDAEREELEADRKGLLEGVDAVPDAPRTRGAGTRTGRHGSAFWQLVDFKDAVSAGARAGLEAALEASGLLDAWVAPDGVLQVAASSAQLLDTQIVPRPAGPSSLAEWLKPAPAIGCSVPVPLIEHLLGGIRCADIDDAQAEVWLAPDGRFRLGSLVGAWRKPSAEYIGFAARAARRERRLAEIALLLATLKFDAQTLQDEFGRLDKADEQARFEWSSMPSDQALREAHADARSCASGFEAARDRLNRADAALREATTACELAKQHLAEDAADLQLPNDEEALSGIERVLEAFDVAHTQLGFAAVELRAVWPDVQAQTRREEDAAGDLILGDERLALCMREDAEAGAHLAGLRDTVGSRVEDLLAQVAAARQAVRDADVQHKNANKTLIAASEVRAVAASQANVTEAAWVASGERRTQSVARLQAFAASGMFAAGAPELSMPDLRTPWTIDPALNLARRAEQALTELNDGDEAWTRVQRQIGEELTDLQRALSALGYQATAEQTDFGQVVHVVFQNRPERPDRLAVRLSGEIADRKELLTAKERHVLEEHLQAEIAAEVQRLLRAADRHVVAINKELHKRPTSTGVRFRLLWQPLPDDDGAPVGLEAARKRLLNTGADLWSADDKRVVGAMLQQRIAAERERTATSTAKDAGGSLPEQLARALDYRRWHRFRVERWQDGQWRKLSGPASSGERALGLTVPLFAAVASFYGQGEDATSPRLILLDEAFAGIDDAARAHCMGLIREFDLDFVITSEREWGCYAELPGVSICQLQRKEGIDAVFVSRWTWDGRAKGREADPDRRFPTP